MFHHHLRSGVRGCLFSLHRPVVGIARAHRASVLQCKPGGARDRTYSSHNRNRHGRGGTRRERERQERALEEFEIIQHGHERSLWLLRFGFWYAALATGGVIVYKCVEVFSDSVFKSTARIRRHLKEKAERMQQQHDQGHDGIDSSSAENEQTAGADMDQEGDTRSLDIAERVDTSRGQGQSTSLLSEAYSAMVEHPLTLPFLVMIGAAFSVFLMSTLRHLVLSVRVLENGRKVQFRAASPVSTKWWPPAAVRDLKLGKTTTDGLLAVRVKGDGFRFLLNTSKSTPTEKELIMLLMSGRELKRADFAALHKAIMGERRSST